MEIWYGIGVFFSLIYFILDYYYSFDRLGIKFWNLILSAFFGVLGGFMLLIVLFYIFRIFDVGNKWLNIIDGEDY